MSFESKHWRTRAAKIVCAAFVFSASVLQPAAAYAIEQTHLAQDDDTDSAPVPSGALVTTGITAPGALEQKIIKVLSGDSSTVKTEAELTTPERPAAPLVSPQVGPIIKEYYADFVERRTTAFIPEDWEVLLASMSPVETPGEVLTDPSPEIDGDYAEQSIERSRNWVHVDLSEQTMVAYTGNTPIRAFVIASGLPGTPTVTGEFHVRTKVRSQTMFGGEGALYYNLPNVEWVQYFYAEFGLHGTYWHNSFGTPRSHGCVNMTNADAKWVFDFLGPVWDGVTIWQHATAINPGGVVIVTE